MNLQSRLLPAIALVLTTHAAQATDVTIKDTRQYAPYTSSIGGLQGCTMPKDLNNPNPENPNECRIKRSTFVVSGELLVRSPQLGVCRREEYSASVAQRTGAYGETLNMPSLTTRTKTFKCNADGAASE